MDQIRNEPLNFEINGLQYFRKNIIPIQNGSVCHMLRCDGNDYNQQFGEIYFSNVKPGAIKGWKFHKKVLQRFTVPRGEVKFVFYDDREQSSSRGKLVTVVLNQGDQFGLLVVPPKLWYSFSCQSEAEALIVNCTTFPHTEGESITIGLNEAKFIPYTWDRPSK